jgi:hypothetical protein
VHVLQKCPSGSPTKIQSQQKWRSVSWITEGVTCRNIWGQSASYIWGCWDMACVWKRVGRRVRGLTCMPVHFEILNFWELRQGSDRIRFAGCCWGDERESGTSQGRLGDRRREDFWMGRLRDCVAWAHEWRLHEFWRWVTLEIEQAEGTALSLWPRNMECFHLYRFLMSFNNVWFSAYRLFLSLNLLLNVSVYWDYCELFLNYFFSD